MPQYRAPINDMRFALHGVLDAVEHLRSVPGGEEVDADLLDSILEQAAHFAEEIIVPLNRPGDEQGCSLTEGLVTTAAGFREAYAQYMENGWPSLSPPAEYGGQGLPSSISFLVNEMLASACHAFVMFPGLSGGCMTTLIHHGTPEQQQMFLPAMVEGRWTGTMCLTEAHCGSDLGLLRTQATPNDDGSYAITGSKIFISAGEHDLAENIVHVVLARLPDAARGTRGISMFIVPKINVNPDGSLGERNALHCASIEHKMGIHANPTCVMQFDGARGYLIGPPGRGLNCMFTFINESRLGVAQQGMSHMEAAYQGSVAYARERLQMRSPTRRDPTKEADPIIVHPDVRRMLLTQKSLAEGGRLLTYMCMFDVDRELRGDGEPQAAAARDLALLTPIAKGFLTEAGMEAANYGVQVFGGHGYIAEHGMEQIVRDQRITQLYEGTTGIQAVDLLARKIIGTERGVLDPFLHRVGDLCQRCEGTDLEQHARTLDHYRVLWSQVTDEVILAASHNPDSVGAAAYDYLMMAGYVTVAYCWLLAMERAMLGVDDLDLPPGFADAKIKTGRFYFERLLPRAQTHATMARSGPDPLMGLTDEQF